MLCHKPVMDHSGIGAKRVVGLCWERGENVVEVWHCVRVARITGGMGGGVVWWSGVGVVGLCWSPEVVIEWLELLDQVCWYWSRVLELWGRLVGLASD